MPTVLSRRVSASCFLVMPSSRQKHADIAAPSLVLPSQFAIAAGQSRVSEGTRLTSRQVVEVVGDAVEPKGMTTGWSLVMKVWQSTSTGLPLGRQVRPGRSRLPGHFLAAGCSSGPPDRSGRARGRASSAADSPDEPVADPHEYFFPLRGTGIAASGQEWRLRRKCPRRRDAWRARSPRPYVRHPLDAAARLADELKGAVLRCPAKSAPGTSLCPVSTGSYSLPHRRWACLGQL